MKDYRISQKRKANHITQEETNEIVEEVNTSKNRGEKLVNSIAKEIIDDLTKKCRQMRLGACSSKYEISWKSREGRYRRDENNAKRLS